MDIVDYELQLDDEVWYVDDTTFAVRKAVCRLVTIKIFKDDENVIQTVVEYLLEMNDNTVVVDEDSVFTTFEGAVTYLGTLYSPVEELT